MLFPPRAWSQSAPPAPISVSPRALPMIVSGNELPMTWSIAFGSENVRFRPAPIACVPVLPRSRWTEPPKWEKSRPLSFLPAASAMTALPWLVEPKTNVSLPGPPTSESSPPPAAERGVARAGDERVVPRAAHERDGTGEGRGVEHVAPVAPDQDRAGDVALERVRPVAGDDEGDVRELGVAVVGLLHHHDRPRRGEDGVLAATARDRVVARTADDRVVAQSAEQGVVAARAADDRVVARATHDRVVAQAAEQGTCPRHHR